MNNKIINWSLLIFAAILLAAAIPHLSIQRINYNIDVKPILNKHCLSCHGGVKQQAGFSLLTREEALRPAESGHPAIIPGNPAGSELIRRLRCPDPEQRMPYQKAALTEQEISTLEQWIKEGANWTLHWSYRPVESPEIPKPKARLWGLWPAKTSTWPQQDLDWFVLNRLDKEQLHPAKAADPGTLAQRVSMDLIGLPLPEKLQNALQNNSGEQAFDLLIDSLLASPRFGERWASTWLDLARYADTKGYERDAKRFIWRYRDWVIRAFNADMPYNQFLTEQLAGDLLPTPTDQQLIATGFHRNTMTNDEGGTLNEEFRIAAVMDRVNTTWTTLMGTTFNCVQCHSHPYDPFKHEEYYQFMAFFNNTRDEDTWEDYPALRHFSHPDSLKLLNLSTWMQENIAPQAATEIELFIKTWQPAYYSIATDSFQNCELYDTKWLTMRHQAQARLKRVNLNGKNQFIWRHAAGVANGQLSIRLDHPDGPELFSSNIDKTAGREIKAIDFNPVSGTHDLWILYKNASLETAQASGLMIDWMRFASGFPTAEKPGWAAAKDSFWQLLRAPSEFTPIMLENPTDMARKTYVFERGNWLVPGASVHPEVPKILPAFPLNAPANRLGLAQWICDTQNPLTARTMVNRIWEQLFGTGLVETLEDLGSQGATPSNQALLDHLAWRFMHVHHWSLKKLLKEIVQSATYQQDSYITPVMFERDPQNLLLARGPRIRLSAEQLRDKTLAVAGLLSDKMYGPGVMPFQPYGIWKSPWNGDVWEQSQDADQYRRAVYTFVKRGNPYPSAETFDLAPREVCAARRINTNTPLQALVMLNDSVFVEAARVMADSLNRNTSPDRQIAAAYKQAIGREITANKLAALQELYQTALTYYSDNPEALVLLLGRQLEHHEKADPPVAQKNIQAQAALTVVSNAILNLDEFLVKS